ncbi:hypothetical protein [Marinobacterium weihaiense]|uniref:Uncharacterized protein n=1 Tax=Marinobacterium weihaiense TaxID=2851016 RepID=A0ABS6MEJ0_9GAMM|nr:hypothetical protein [Marinobacterium weihaiense]MBV0934731.1 hypothetical protein [Marinobacterium weihaiense]
MATDLKQDNKKSIFLLLSAVIIVCGLIQSGLDTLTMWTDLLITGTLSPVIAASALVLTNLLPASAKHKVVFTRLVDEMPGSRVDRLCRKDSRLVYSDLVARWPEIFSDDAPPDARNAMWYRNIYKPVQDVDSVLQSHRWFLLYRDTLSGLISITLLIGLWDALGNPSLLGEIKPLVYGALAGCSLIVLIAARNMGNRFVVNAVAAAL